MKKTLIIALLVLFAVAGNAKTIKTIKTPVAMGHNIYGGELIAREVVMTDTATTVRFTIDYPSGEIFQFANDCYLMDEDGKRYPLRCAEGIALKKWIKSPDSRLTDFTMHFEPLPKKVQIFDFIEGDDSGDFKLLGIHDMKYKIKYPTMEELSEANPWTVPADWFKIDTITIQGRIEDYNAERLGFDMLHCYYKDEFEKGDAVQVLNIAPDGTFCKKFRISYPFSQLFWTRDSKTSFDEIPFFARPGEIIDVTVRIHEDGGFDYAFNSGSSRDVERWLCSSDEYNDVFRPLNSFKGKLEEGNKLSEVVWNNAMYRLQSVSRRKHYTPMEMQLALADIQTNFIERYLSYVDNHESSLVKYEERDGNWHIKILDSMEYEKLYDTENYYPLRHIDFNNPLLLASQNFHYALNQIQYVKPVMKVLSNDSLTESQRYSEYYAALRQTLGTRDDTMMAQLCSYKEMLNNFNYWRNKRDFILEHLKLHGVTSSDSIGRKMLEEVPSVEERFNLFLTHITHPYIRQKAKQFYTHNMAQMGLSSSLPDAPMAELIRSLCAKYPGKILMIDFWGMSCGPCRGAIQQSKQLRAEIAKRDDVKLIFIAGESTPGGSEAYHKYVKEWLDGEEAICVSNEDFSRFEELFQFSGIPHYETITPDGRRVRDDLQIDGYYNFDGGMQLLKAKFK